MMILVYSVVEAAYVLNESQQSPDFRSVRRLHFFFSVVYWLSILHEMSSIVSPCSLDLLVDCILLFCLVLFLLLSILYVYVYACNICLLVLIVVFIDRGVSNLKISEDQCKNLV